MYFPIIDALKESYDEISNLKSDLKNAIELYKIYDYTCAVGIDKYAGNATINISENTVHVETTGANQYVIFQSADVNGNRTILKNGRKYKIVLSASPVTGNNLTVVLAQYGQILNWNLFAVNVSATEPRRNSILYTADRDYHVGIYFYVSTGESVDVKLSIYDVTDLTEKDIDEIDFYAQEPHYIRVVATEVQPQPRSVVCWGDSLTYGFGASPGENDYPTVLGRICSRKVTNLGISGEASNEIIARQGGFPAYIAPVTIPAKGSVPISFMYTINTGASGPTTLGRQNRTEIINPVTIGGIKGSLSYANGEYSFTRAEDGESVTFETPQYITCSNDIDHRNDVQCIYIGTNGGWLVTSDQAQTRIEKLLSQIDMMIDHSTSKDFIVIGLTHYYSWVLYNGLTREMVEVAMQRHYGRHYINLREYLVNYGLQDVGITPTSADEEAISNGNVPPSLLYTDGIHGNASYYKILAELVNRKGVELGYW